jgi:hypothetical protein
MFKFCHPLFSSIIAWQMASNFMYEQFAPGNPSEVLVTSADSRIRILDGSDITHKFKGISIYNHLKSFSNGKS